MSEEMKQVPIDLSHVFELLSNKKNDILDIDYSNDNDSYPTVRAVKNYVDDLQTILDSKASTTDLTNGLMNIGAFTIHTVYNVSGSASAYDISSGLSYTQLTPVFFLVKNNIGDNEANATLKYYPNGNNVTIMDTFSTYYSSPIQKGVWKKDTWALFFCYGNNTVQLRCVFYDSVDIDKKILDLSELELIDSTHSLASTANWTGTSTRLTSLTKGTRILYRITYVPTATSQGANLSIKFTNNTSSSSIPIIFSNGTPTYGKWFTSSIAKNDVLLLEYDGTNWVLLDFFAIGERPKVARTGSYNDLSDKPIIPTIPTNVSAFNNDSGYLTAHQDITGKEDKSNKVTSLSSSSTDTQYPSAKCVYDTVDIVDDKVSVVYNTVSIIDTSDSVYDADRWTEDDSMHIIQQSGSKFIAGGYRGYVIYDGNISNLDNYDIILNLRANKTNTLVFINDNNIGTLPTSQTSILFKKRDGVVKVVYDNNQYDASSVKIIAANVMSRIRYTIDIVLYQGMIYDVIDSIPSKTSDLTNDSGFITISSVPSASSTTPSADTASGSVGTGITWARSDHTHPKSSLYAEASHTHSEYVNPTIIDNLTTNDATKVLSAKQGKVLNDMIGDAIEYINQ